MTPFPYKNISPTQISLDNNVLGKHRKIKVNIGKESYTLSFTNHIPSYTAQHSFKISDGNDYFWIGLNNIPQPSSLDPDLSDIHFENLPESIRLILLNTALGNLLSTAEKALQRHLSIETLLHQAPPKEFDHALYFTLTGSKQSFSGHFDVNSSFYSAISDALKRAKPSPSWNYMNVPIQASISAGSTEISNAEFRKIRGSDIILIDDNNFIENKTLFIILSPKQVLNARYDNGKITTQ